MNLRHHEPHIPGHEHRGARHDDGTCDSCRWCDDCDAPTTLDDDPHWTLT